MYKVTLSTPAVIGLFAAHRMYPPQGIDQVRVSVDTERLLERFVKVIDDKGNVAVTLPDPPELSIENGVREHLKRAVIAGMEAKRFNYDAGSPRPAHGADAFDAIDKAVKDTP